MNTTYVGNYVVFIGGGTAATNKNTFTRVLPQATPS